MWEPESGSLLNGSEVNDPMAGQLPAGELAGAEHVADTLVTDLQPLRGFTDSNIDHVKNLSRSKRLYHRRARCVLSATRVTHEEASRGYARV